MAVVVGACGGEGDRAEVRTDGATTSLTFRLGHELTDKGVDQLTSILENRLDALGAQGALVTVEHGRPQMAEVTSIGGRGWFPRG